MQSRSLERRFICMVVLYACLRRQGPNGNMTAQHKNVCINCTCYDQHKNMYNLWPLQNLDDSEYPSLSKTHGGYTYSYSPCKSFTLGSPDRSNCRNNVAICQSVTNVYYQKLAEQGKAKLEYDGDKKRLQLIYNKIVTWKPKVILKCDSTIEDAIFDIVDVDYDWTFSLTHRCACPNACLTDPSISTHSSPGSQNKLIEEISIPVGAFIVLLPIAGLVLWKRRQRQHNGNDIVNQGDNERQRLVGGVAERAPTCIVSFNNQMGGRRSEPFASKSCNITVSKTKNDLNKLNAPL